MGFASVIVGVNVVWRSSLDVHYSFLLDLIFYIKAIMKVNCIKIASVGY